MQRRFNHDRKTFLKDIFLDQYFLHRYFGQPLTLLHVLRGCADSLILRTSTEPCANHMIP